MLPPVNPETPHDATIRELANLLATGVIRHLEQRHHEALSQPKTVPESRQDCLELPRTTVLSVLTGLPIGDSETGDA